MEGEDRTRTGWRGLLAKIVRGCGGPRRFLALVVLVGGPLLFLQQSLLVVPPRQAAVLIRKTGRPLPPGKILALEPGERGVQLPVVLEGWHFRNAYHWDWVLVDQVEIPEGKVGVRVRRFGKPLPPGRILVESLPRDEEGHPVLSGEIHRGILREVLRPGRYAVNPMAEEVQWPLSDAVVVPPGHVGVVNLVAGRDPEDPNVFVVAPGERGIQPDVVTPGTYYVNPFERRIHVVDLRSHRFDGTIEFPSEDGFPITLEGTMEWAVDRERVPEVFMKYLDTRDLMPCIVEKVILPNARAFSRLQGSKHLARDFISGETRREFQDRFARDVTRSCALQGIRILSVLVRGAIPPQEIALPIREREIAIRLREKFEHQKAREVAQKELAQARREEYRRKQVKQAEADASVAVTRAEQARDVARIEAERSLEVARKVLEAARNRAQADLARGMARAQVTRLENLAEARGLEETVRALGGSPTYLRTLRNRRLAASLRTLEANTRGPLAALVVEGFSGTIREGGGEVPEASPTRSVEGGTR